VLITPSAAFANDLAPVTTPLPLQRILLLLAAILLPIEVALRRLRISPIDLLDWLRHPRRLEIAAPWTSGDSVLQPPAWVPGRWTIRRPPRVAPRTFSYDTPLARHATPGLARQTDSDEQEDEALAATLKWLAARRGNSRGDSG
jgi:hypothetical protein